MGSLAKGRTRDMTTGNVFQNILMFAIPLFISNFFQQCYNICDTMIASHNLGEHALAAIGLTGSISGLIIGFANGMNNGYGIIIARSFGAQNEKKIKEAVAWDVVLNLALSVLLTAVTLLFTKPMLQLIQTPADIFPEAEVYIRVVLSGITATLFYNMESGILRAVGNSRTPLYFLIFSCSINIMMDLIFVRVLHLGVAGIALATVFAQIICSILCLIHILRKYHFLIPGRGDFVFQPELISEMLTTGFSMGMMNSIFQIGSVMLQGAINTLGTDIIAAHTAARRVVMIGNMPLSSIASANATFVSQNYGARKSERIREGIKKSIGLDVIWLAIYIAGVLIFSDKLIYALTGSRSAVILDNARMNLRINMLLFPPLGVLLILRTSLQGLGHRILPLISSSLELIIKGVAAFIFVPLWGYFGASIAEPSTWLICMLFLLVSFVKVMKKES